MTNEAPSPSKIIPNTFQTPNVLAADDDSIMSMLTGNEVKCYVAIVRKTFGWHKQSDRISKKQIMRITGLGEEAVENCMASLVSYGLILRLAENNPAQNYGVEWSLQTNDERVRWDLLRLRVVERKEKKIKAAISGGGDNAPQVENPPEGGGVYQPNQKPLSKANNNNDNKAAEVFNFYQNEIGMLTPIIRDKINLWLDEDKVLAQWINDAIRLAVVQNKRNWAYVEAILKNWKANGKDAPKPKGAKNANGYQANAGQTNAAPEYSDEDRAAAERIKKRRKVQ